MQEFGESVSAAEIHRLLRNRRKGQNEIYCEYLYALDVANLLDYFVEDIPDSRFNKTILYHAVEEMKKNMMIYEKIRTSSNRDSRRPKASNNVEFGIEMIRSNDTKLKTRSSS